MLYHWEPDQLVHFYARNPKDISASLTALRKRPGEPAAWVHTPLDPITEMPLATVCYHAGPISFQREGLFYSMQLPITPDFTICASPESIPFLHQARRQMQKIGPLYLFHIPGIFYPSLCFIPADIRKGLWDYDFKPLLYEAKTIRAPLEAFLQKPQTALQEIN